MERWKLTSEVVALLEDENFRPHLVLQTKVVGTCGIPDSVIKPDGHVVLNVSPQATGGTLRIGMYQCACNITVGGQHYSVAWHPDAVVAVYSPDGGPKLVYPTPDLEDKPIDRRESKPKLSLVGGPDWNAGFAGNEDD